MLRPAVPADTETLVTMAEATGVFKPHEIVALREVLDDFYELNHEFGHRAMVGEEDGNMIGFVYMAPTAMTDRTWELWWIVVDVARQRGGFGGKMLQTVEADVQAAHGRILLIETSSTPAYEPTRQFYRKHGYAEVATIPDFYSDGDGKVIFSKRM